MDWRRGQVQKCEIAVLADAVFFGLRCRSVEMVMQRQEKYEQEYGGSNETALGPA